MAYEEDSKGGSEEDKGRLLLPFQHEGRGSRQG
jgi:hypothetical protein